jgi:hypothetical protein
MSGDEEASTWPPKMLPTVGSIDGYLKHMELEQLGSSMVLQIQILRSNVLLLGGGAPSLHQLQEEYGQPL